jgi:hypothetical protein
MPANEDMSKTLSLANIRSSLIRQEDTIIFQLIERAQFARNTPVYVSEGVPVPGACGHMLLLGKEGRWWGVDLGLHGPDTLSVDTQQLSTALQLCCQTYGLLTCPMIQESLLFCHCVLVCVTVSLRVFLDPQSHPPPSS